MTQSRDPSHRRGLRGPYNPKPKQDRHETYILICLDGPDPSGPQQYKLATPRIFVTREQALAYSTQIHPMRKPLIVAGDWIGFRIPSL